VFTLSNLQTPVISELRLIRGQWMVVLRSSRVTTPPCWLILRHTLVLCQHQLVVQENRRWSVTVILVFSTC